MDWKLLLGILIGLATSVFGNLLTPLVKSSWIKWQAWQTRGYESSLRRQIRVLDTQRDALLRRHTESNRDFFLYLSQWFLGISTAFVLACGCAFIGFTAHDATAQAQLILLNAALILLVLTLVLGLLVMSECRSFTSRGVQKRLADLDARKATLVAKLPTG